MRRTIISIIAALALIPSIAFGGRVVQNYMYNDSTATRLQSPTGDYFSVGTACTTGHTLNSADDLIHCGEVEVDGDSFFDNSITATFAADDLITIDAATVDQTQTAGVINLNVDAGVADVSAINTTITGQGDFSFIGNQLNYISGGTFTGFPLMIANDTTLTSHVNDAGGFMIGNLVGSKTATVGANAFYGHMVIFKNVGVGPWVDMTGTGNIIAFNGIVEATNGAGNVSGLGLEIACNTVACTSLAGANIKINRSIAGIGSADILSLEASGTVVSDRGIVITGTMTTGIDLGSVTGMATAIQSPMGSWGMTLGAADTVTIDAGSTLHTGVPGILTLGLAPGVAGAQGIELTIEPADADYNGQTGMSVASTATAGGGGAGNSTYNYNSLINGDDNDTNHNYLGYQSVIQDLTGTSAHTHFFASGSNSGDGEISGFKASLDTSGTGSILGANLAVTQSGGTGNAIGAQITATNSAVAAGVLTGLDVTVNENIAGATTVVGVDIGEGGSQTGTSAIQITDTWTNGIDTTGATVAIVLKVDNGIVQTAVGTPLASANDMAAPDTNYCVVTGATQINTMAATNWNTGSYLCLKFDSNPVLKHKTAGTGVQFNLAGSGDATIVAGARLCFVTDGSYWTETSRTYP